MKLYALAVLTAGLLGTAPATASTETVLHNQCSSTGCTDGGGVQAQLIKSGNILYGVGGNGGAHMSGSHSGGVVFQYDLSTSTYTVLYSFCSTIHLMVCTDGESPVGRLVIDTSGNLYGTTSLGGNTGNAGTVFKLTKSGGTWSLTTLYKFCPDKINDVLCEDGNEPLSGLTYYGQASGTAYDGTSPLYGSTFVGGDDATDEYGNGVLFELSLSGGVWSEGVLHEFCWACTEGCTSCSEGERPFGQMIIDSTGAIYGSTLIGGAGQGTVFKYASAALTTLYTFCTSHSSPCSDGGQPTGVLLDASGNVYGTGQVGGSGGTGTGGGVLFKLTNSGGTWSESVKYNFCSASSCTDGWAPRGDLIMDGSGNVLGTTAVGGSSAHAANGGGTIWKYNGTSESVLYDFCASSTTCADGEDPGAGVMIDASGNLYGDTILGGSAGGVIFKFAP